MSTTMHAIIGITGQVGGTAARHLLAQGLAVRGILRNPAKAAAWQDEGAETVVAALDDAAALTDAFAGTKGVFVMTPPWIAEADMLGVNRVVIAALKQALLAARVPKLVFLSSIGAHRQHGLGPIQKLREMELLFADLPMPAAVIRAAWFMENYAGMLPVARETGTLPSLLQPFDRAIAMVATADIGRAAADLLQQDWQGRRIIELEGPSPYAPVDVAAALAAVLGRAVMPVAIPHQQRVAMFESAGCSPQVAAAFAETVDGFNAGWIDFARRNTEHLRGATTIEHFFRSLPPAG